MPFVIQLKTDRDAVDQMLTTIQKDVHNQYVGQVIFSVVKKRFLKPDIIKQIILTKDIEEAERFVRLADAQDYWRSLIRINSQYLFHIREVDEVEET